MSNKIVLKAYNEFWKFERVIYKFEGVKLPVPITPRQFILFIYGEGVMFILLKIPGINLIKNIPYLGHPLMIFLVYPYLIMKYLSSKKFDGKAPHKYLWDIIQFLIFTQKKWEHYRPVKRPFKEKFNFKIPYRLEQIKSSIELNFIKKDKKDKKNKQEYRNIYHANY